MFEAMNRAPTHPGTLLDCDVLPATELSKGEFAEMLDLSVETLNDILAAKRPINAETALKLGALFNNSPQFWMRMQSSYDLWDALQAIDQAKLEELRKKHHEFHRG